MKRQTSTNDNRGKHPYLIASNWMPGGRLCYWNNYRTSNPDYCERMDKWAESIQNQRPKDNLITNNYADKRF